MLKYDPAADEITLKRSEMGGLKVPPYMELNNPNAVELCSFVRVLNH